MTAKFKPKKVNGLAPFADNSNGFNWDNGIAAFGNVLEAPEKKRIAKDKARNNYKKKHQ